MNAQKGNGTQAVPYSFLLHAKPRQETLPGYAVCFVLQIIYGWIR